MMWSDQQHSLFRKKCHPHWYASTHCNCFYSYTEAFVMLLEMNQQPLAPIWQRLLLSCVTIIKYLDFMGTTASGRTDKPKPANFPLY